MQIKRSGVKDIQEKLDSVTSFTWITPLSQ